jgi:GDP-4-dehydro-6-deoxy-D-mannose reductase
VKVGNLDVVRDYLDVRDAAAAYLAILENGKDGAVYNIARGEPRRLGEVLEMLLAKSRVPVEVEADTTRRRPFDIDYQAGDAGKLMKDTGWKPLIPLDRTLEDLLQYWREAGREKARGARKRVDNI